MPGSGDCRTRNRTWETCLKTRNGFRCDIAVTVLTLPETLRGGNLVVMTVSVFVFFLVSVWYSAFQADGLDLLAPQAARKRKAAGEAAAFPDLAGDDQAGVVSV